MDPPRRLVLEGSDIVVSFDGHDVTAMRQLPSWSRQSLIDKEVEIVFLRKGERKVAK